MPSIKQSKRVMAARARDAVRALVVANNYLHERNRELAGWLKLDFLRGRLPTNNVFEDGLDADLDWIGE